MFVKDGTEKCKIFPPKCSLHLTPDSGLSRLRSGDNINCLLGMIKPTKMAASLGGVLCKS